MIVGQRVQRALVAESVVVGDREHATMSGVSKPPEWFANDEAADPRRDVVQAADLAAKVPS